MTEAERPLALNATYPNIFAAILGPDNRVRMVEVVCDLDALWTLYTGWGTPADIEHYKALGYRAIRVNLYPYR